MNFLFGHDDLRMQLHDAVQSGSLPQTLLFHGAEGIGKKRVALELTAKILALKSNQILQDAIGTDQILQRMLTGHHPDFFWIRPTPTKSDQKKSKDEPDGLDVQDVLNQEIQSNWTIKTEQFQEVRSRLVHFPMMADFQVVLIEDVERMTVTTANSLLKILEEPRTNQIFILVTNQLHRVLSTIRSRSTKFHFAALPKSQVLSIVRSVLDCSKISFDESGFDFLFSCFGGSILPIIQVLKSGIALKDLINLDTVTLKFERVVSLVAEIKAMNLDLELVFAIVREAKLQKVRANQSAHLEDIDFFNRLRSAEYQLQRHVSGDFVLENLFL